jgi:hypothetical protein
MLPAPPTQHISYSYLQYRCHTATETSGRMKPHAPLAKEAQRQAGNAVFLTTYGVVVLLVTQRPASAALEWASTQRCFTQQLAPLVGELGWYRITGSTPRKYNTCTASGGGTAACRDCRRIDQVFFWRYFTLSLQ